ncbi:hypothetical protein ASZ90_014878 [hydrocarbon metagenome]|uniref:Uncharacterized protein n=1 Tax=hydrocarbon metagenome TaxID=938273 RepID=A0A0W8F3N2_9ZZZZ
MRAIEGVLITRHRHAGCVAQALAPDNLQGMQSCASGDEVRTTVSSPRLRSLIASVDDYLTNCAIAEDLCSYTSD